MATAIDAEKWSDEYKDAKCSNCAEKKKDQIADYYCYDCNKHLCTPCLGFHNDWNENHNVVKGQGDNKDVLTEKCRNHADELITLYCRLHAELLCKKCRLLDHSSLVKEVSTKAQDISSQGAVGGEADIPVQEIVRSLEDRQVKRPVQKRRPVVRPEKKRINVRIPGDEHTCYSSGSCYLSDGSLMVADYRNKRLKLVDPSSGNVTKFCDTDGQPTDVCCIGPQEVAVAIDSTKVHVYNTVSRIRTRTAEWGHKSAWIACHGGLLYCAGYGQILSVHDLSSGRELMEISMDTDGRKLFSYIRHIAVNSSGDRVYVTDWERGLVCVGVGGKPIFCLSLEDLGLSCAEGVTTDHQGHVFVCGADSQNVVKVTEDGHVVGQILSVEDGITWRPFCLSYDVSRSYLFVGGESDQLLIVEWK